MNKVKIDKITDSILCGLIIIIITCGLVSCDDKGGCNIYSENHETGIPIFTRSDKFVFEGHEYIAFRRCGYISCRRYGYCGVVHNPECKKCNKSTNK